MSFDSYLPCYSTTSWKNLDSNYRIWSPKWDLKDGDIVVVRGIGGGIRDCINRQVIIFKSLVGNTVYGYFGYSLELDAMTVDCEIPCINIENPYELFPANIIYKKFLLDKMKAFGLELDTVDKGIVSIKKPIAFLINKYDD